MTQPFRARRGRAGRSLARRSRFTFDGGATTAHPGDTLASALLANGVHLVGRSFKYHRPRGILRPGAEEPNALVTVVRGRRAHHAESPRHAGGDLRRAGRQRARTAGRRWPSTSARSTISRRPCFRRRLLLQDLHGPGGGLGRPLRADDPRGPPALASRRAQADPDRYTHRYAHCDVLVVGGGPAGLAAALAASEDAAARVILCDEQAELGGSSPGRARRRRSTDTPAADWAARALADACGP